MRIVLVLVLTAGIARADGDDPRVLFAEGRYAAAADVFEHRWQAKGDPLDGVNAVVAWRTAGHYARALALLTKLRASASPPTGDAAATAAALDERLATLTATATIDGTVDTAAIVRSDADAVERIGNAIILDVGEHDVSIEQAGCDTVTQHVVAYPGAPLVLPYHPHCEMGGTLHVYLGGDPDGAFAVDGARHVVQGYEADVKLEPGRHTLHVESRARPVYDETLDIRPKETTAVRVRYPWRARGLGFILGVTTEVHGGQRLDGIALGPSIGLWSSRFRFIFEGGSMISNVPGLNPGSGTPGRPWAAWMFALHVFHGPLWHGKAGAYRLALDFDPIAFRFDEVRENSYGGILLACDIVETRVRALSAMPFALSADGPYVHTEVTLWPISYVSFRPKSAACSDAEMPAQTGWGAGLTIMGAWRL